MSEDNKQESFDIELNSLRMNSYSPYGFNDTSNVSRGRLKEYIKYPMIYNAILRAISEQAYNKNGLYANVIDYMVDIPTLSYITIVDKDANSSTKKKAKKFDKLMYKIKHDKTTRDILTHGFIYGMYVGILRDTSVKQKTLDDKDTFDTNFRRLEGLTLDDNFQIEPLPIDYCRIRGLMNGDNVAQFDLSYFDQWQSNGLVGQIKNFPDDIIKAYMKYKKTGQDKWYTLDYRKTVALKFRATVDEPYGRPLGLSAFLNMKASEDYNDNQSNIVDELASSIYHLTLPEGVDGKNACSLNNKQQEQLIHAFECAVKSNTGGGGAKISTLTLPPKAKLDRLSKDSSLLKDTLSDELSKKISTDLGFASSALNAQSAGGASYSTLSVNIDLVSSQVFRYVNEIAYEYTRVLNYHLGIKKVDDFIKVTYLPISWINKDDMCNKMKELYTLGCGSRKMWIASTGVNPEDYISLMQQEKDENLDDLFVPHATSYTTSSETENKNGRPQKDEDELSESGQVARNLNTNKQAKPSTK